MDKWVKHFPEISWLGVSVVFFFMLAVGVWTHIEEGPPRADVSRIKVDMRSLDTAIEDFAADHGTFPRWAYSDEINPTIPTFAQKDEQGRSLRQLTTPIAYVTSLYPDVFSPERKSTYCYWSRENTEGTTTSQSAWIFWSAGPDGDYDLTVEKVERAFGQETQRAIDASLLEHSYDPTNGKWSGGDLWRRRR